MMLKMVGVLLAQVHEASSCSSGGHRCGERGVVHEPCANARAVGSGVVFMINVPVMWWRAIVNYASRMFQVICRV